MRYDASSAAAKVLHHLGVATLTFASDLAFGVLLYLIFQPTVIAGLCTVVYAQKFGPGRPILRRFANDQ